MAQLQRIKVFAAKQEATIGTAETLTASEAGYNAYDIKIENDIPVQEREAEGSADHLSGVPGPHMGTATFKTPIVYDGVTVPIWASVLLPCTMYEQNTNTMNPLTEGLKSSGTLKTATIGAYLDGTFKSIAGAVGTWKANLPAGELCFIEWEFKGVWQPPTDATLIEQTDDTTIPSRYASATTQYDSIDLCVKNIVVDAGIQTEMIECTDTSQGYESGIAVDRYPKVTADPLADLVANRDDFGDLLAASEALLSITIPGAGNSTIEFNIPKAQLFGVQEGERDKIVVNDLEWRCNKNGATKDRDLNIVFTPTV